MKKLILSLLLCSTAWASKTTLTGTITDGQGNGLNGVLIMQLPVPAQDTTTNTAVHPSPVFFRLVNGAITGGAQLYDVATLQPQGLYYVASVYDPAGNKVMGGAYYVTGASFNLGAATPTSVLTANVAYANLCLIAPGTCPGSINVTQAVTAQSVNDVLIVGGASGYSTCAAAITAAGSVNKVIIEVDSTYAGAECPTNTNVDGIQQSITTPNITIIDHRGGTVGHNLDFNSSAQDPANHIQTRLSVWNYNSNLATNFTTSAILGTNQITGPYPSSSVAAITGEIDTTGALTSMNNGILQAVNCEFHVRSTGQTIPFVSGCEGGGGIDRAGGSTNIQTASSIAGDTITNIGTGTIQDAYSVRGSNQTIGTRNNYAFASPSGGNWAMSDNTCLHIFNGSTGQKLICYGIDNASTGGINLWGQTSPSIPAVMKFLDGPATHTNYLIGSQNNVSNVFEITPSTAAGGTTFSTPAFLVGGANGGNPGFGCCITPLFPLHIETTIAGDKVAKIRNLSATGSALDLIPGADTGSGGPPPTPYALGIQNAAGSQNNLVINGLGTIFSRETSTVPTAIAAWDICYPDSTLHAIKCAFNNGSFFQVAQEITATSAAFATATTAGTCVQNVTAVSGATTSMAVSVSPVSTPGVGAQWSAFVSSAGNVTINECAVAASAGGTIAFNIRVIP